MGMGMTAAKLEPTPPKQESHGQTDLLGMIGEISKQMSEVS
jgi:hypothetical protein